MNGKLLVARVLTSPFGAIGLLTAPQSAALDFFGFLRSDESSLQCATFMTLP